MADMGSLDESAELGALPTGDRFGTATAGVLVATTELACNEAAGVLVATTERACNEATANPAVLKRKHSKVRLPPQLQMLMQQLVFECKVHATLHGLTMHALLRAFTSWQAAAMYSPPTGEAAPAALVAPAQSTPELANAYARVSLALGNERRDHLVTMMTMTEDLQLSEAVADKASVYQSQLEQMVLRVDSLSAQADAAGEEAKHERELRATAEHDAVLARQAVADARSGQVAAGAIEALLSQLAESQAALTGALAQGDEARHAAEEERSRADSAEARAGAAELSLQTAELARREREETRKADSMRREAAPSTSDSGPAQEADAAARAALLARFSGAQRFLARRAVQASQRMLLSQCFRGLCLNVSGARLIADRRRFREMIQASNCEAAQQAAHRGARVVDPLVALATERAVY